MTGDQLLALERARRAALALATRLGIDGNLELTRMARVIIDELEAARDAQLAAAGGGLLAQLMTAAAHLEASSPGDLEPIVRDLQAVAEVAEESANNKGVVREIHRRMREEGDG